MTTYVMEALENYPADFAAAIDGSGVPWEGSTSQSYLSIGINRTSREIMYSVCWQPEQAAQDNPYAYEMRDGIGNIIAIAGTFDQGQLLNFYICKKHLDTGVVTKYFTHDPANIVPFGVFGAGNIRRSVNASANQTQAPHLVDPDSGDVWVHHASGSNPSDLAPCSINVFRAADGFTQQIYPLYASHAGYNHMEMMGLGADWFVCWQAKTAYLPQSIGYISISPRATTTDEAASGYKQIYAEFLMPVGTDNVDVGSFWPCWCMAADGGAYIFGFVDAFSPNPLEYKLLKFALPSSAPFGGPVVGGGVTDITPWTSSTGPNWNTGHYVINTFPADNGWQQIAWKDDGADILFCVSTQSWLDTSDFGPGQWATGGADATYVNMTTLAFETHQRFIGPFMTAAWATTADIAAAAWVPIKFQRIDGDIPMHAGAFVGVDTTTRWFQIVCSPVSGGVVDEATSSYHIIFARYRFAVGSAPTLLTWYDEQGWDDAYPAYATAIGNANVVYKSTATPSNGIPGEMMYWDESTSSFIGSGGGSGGASTPNAFYLFDEAFAARQADAGAVAAPFMKLSLVATPGSGRRAHVWSQIGAPQVRSRFTEPAPPASAPVNTALPVITGAPVVGATLVASTGAWANSPTSFAYQFNADAVPITGATSASYAPVEGDVGKILTVEVIASNAAGPSPPATSAAVGPVAEPSAYPAAVVSTGLQAVYDLRLGGAGPTVTPTKTFAANSAELASLGAIWGADGAGTYLEFPGGITVDGFDFRGMNRKVFLWSTTSNILFTNCIFDETCGIGVGCAHGNNPKPLSVMVATFSHCTLDNGGLFTFYGGAFASYSKLINQDQMYWQTYGEEIQNVNTGWDHCYITGGGLAPAVAAHVELTQIASRGNFYCTNCLVDITNQAGVDLRPISAAWTAVLALVRDTNFTALIENSIFIGLTQTIALYAGKLPTCIAYNNGTAANITITNNVLEAGDYGYAFNENGGLARPTNGGNNRDFNTNAVITF